MTKLCFIDTETTGLNAVIHEVWEVGMIIQNSDEVELTEYVWQLPVDLTMADPIALNIGRFHDRRWPTLVPQGLDQPVGHEVTHGDQLGDPTARHQVPPAWMPYWAERFVKLTRGAHLIGNVTSFDEERLRRLLMKHGQVPMWHYHIICAENLIAGRLALPPPWKSKELSEAVGVPVPQDQHSALADARWAKDMYWAVMDEDNWMWNELGQESWEELARIKVLTERSNADKT